MGLWRQRRFFNTSLITIVFLLCLSTLLSLFPTCDSLYARDWKPWINEYSKHNLLLQVDEDLIDLMKQPKGKRSDSLAVEIPCLPIEIELEPNKKITYLGNGVQFTPSEGPTLMETGSRDRILCDLKLQQKMNELNYKSLLKDPPFCSLVIDEKLFPRKYMNASWRKPIVSTGVDISITANLYELAIFLDNNMQFVNILDSELQQWYFHTSIVFRSIADTFVKMLRDYNDISLTQPIEVQFYPALTGEMIVWLDIARITAFCGLDGLQMFWKIIQDDAHTPKNDTIDYRHKDQHWMTLISMCGVSSHLNLNRILFRRSSASMQDNIPGIVSMLRVNGSTIHHAISPLYNDVRLADE